MSVDYYLVCHACQQKIHVAQDGLSGWTFYSGERDCMAKLSAWLEDHTLDKATHRLVLHNEDAVSSAEYPRIHWTPNHLTETARSCDRAAPSSPS